MISHLIAGVDRAMSTTTPSTSFDAQEEEHDHRHRRHGRHPNNSNDNNDTAETTTTPMILKERERLLVIDLTRVLHCMKLDEAPGDQSWQNILFRAQFVQELWRQLCTVPTTTGGNNDNSNWINRNPKLYHDLAQKVDTCCRRANEIANQMQQQEEAEMLEEVRDVLRETTNQFNDEDDEEDNHPKTTKRRMIHVSRKIDQIFFRPMDGASSSINNDNTVEEAELLLDDSEAMVSEGYEESTSDHPTDEEEDVQNEDSESTTKRHGGGATTTTRGGHHPKGRATSTADNNNSSNGPKQSVEELQRAQREQMESAIAAMVNQMKVATQNIHSQIQQQTNVVLDEMEDVAEQNVQDLTQVVDNVQQHNTNRWKSNFGTWTLFFSLVGIFCFCVMIIFTIPKRYDACLFFCSSSYNNHRHYDNSKWEEVFRENELERQEKERLAKVLQDMQKKENSRNEETQQPNLEDDDDDEYYEEDDDYYGEEDMELSSWEQYDPNIDVDDDDMHVEEQDDDDDDDEVAEQETINVPPKQQPIMKKGTILEDDTDPFNRLKPIKDPAHHIHQEMKENFEDNKVNDDTRIDVPVGGKGVVDETDPFNRLKPIKDPTPHTHKEVPEQLSNRDNQEADGVKYDIHGSERPTLSTKDAHNEQHRPHHDRTQIDNVANGEMGEETINDTEGQGFHGGSDGPQDVMRQEVVPNEQDEMDEKKDRHTSHNTDEGKREGMVEPVESPNDLRDALIESIRQKTLEKADETKTEKADGDQSDGFGGFEVAQERQYKDAFPRTQTASVHFSPRDLRVAAANGDLELVQTYVKSKPEYLDRKDKNGWSSLHMAARAGHAPVVEYLMEAGAELETATKDNLLPLTIAVDRWGEDHPIPLMLRKAGAKLPHEVKEEENYDNYIEEGRSRLDKLLGSLGGDDEHDEL